MESHSTGDHFFVAAAPFSAAYAKKPKIKARTAFFACLCCELRSRIKLHQKEPPVRGALGAVPKVTMPAKILTPTAIRLSGDRNLAGTLFSGLR